MSRFGRCATSLYESLNYVQGKRVSSLTAAATTFPVYEPASGKLVVECGESSTATVNEAVEGAKKAFQVWANTPALDRAKVLHNTSKLILKHIDELAYWETKDNGKPLYESRVDIMGCADIFDFFGSACTTAHGRYHDLRSSLDRVVLESREPLGVCAGIGAWNYPFQTASWKLAPALACGNAFVYKPSPWSPLTATLLADLLTEAGAPSGLVSILQGGAVTGQALCEHDDISKVSFTGSVATGKRIQQACANQSLKPVTLELGGKSALIVFEDANLNDAVAGAMMANFYSQGQVCSNASRVFVHESIVPQFTSMVVDRVKGMRVGDPLHAQTTVGAMIHNEHMHKVLNYVHTAREQGARILLGGERVAVQDEGCAEGYYVSPCVVADVTDNMTVMQEEVFGSLLIIIPFTDQEQVIQAANNTSFGLAAGLFTSNLHRAHAVSARLSAGSVYVNTYNDVAACVPSGGFKDSGHGRENGLAAMQHYSQTKAVWMNTSDQPLQAPF